MTKAKKTPPRLYTKTGDKGESNVLVGGRLPKNHPVFEVVGTLDELNSFLGDAVVSADITLKPELQRIQYHLFTIGGMVAGSKSVEITAKELNTLEERIDFYQANTRDDWYKNFLLPGGSPLAAKIDICRSVCRRLERRLITLSQDSSLTTNHQSPVLSSFSEGGLIMQFINRLSDYFFALRCYVNAKAHITEVKFNTPV